MVVVKKLLNAIANSSVTEQISLLPQAIKYGKLGIDFLIECLEDTELEIRAKAYQLLQDVDLQKAKDAIAPGLLFNPGDCIYDVIENYIDFSDGFGRCCLLYSSEKTDAIKNLVTCNDYRHENYKIVSFDREVYARACSFDRYYLNRKQAQSKVELLQKQKISAFSIAQFILKQKRPTIEQWCDQYQIIEKVIEFQKNEDDKGSYDKSDNIVDQFDIDCSTVEKYLKDKNNLELLNQLWQDFVGEFAGVYEICFDKKTYLTIDPYYSSILKQKKEAIYEDSQGSLSSEDAEMNLLLTALNHPKLETRSIAYQLLQGIESEKAQESIYGGIKLNLGDKVYSVYQSGMGFDDQEYHLLPDYIDYCKQIYLQIEGSYQDHPSSYAQRKYCFTDKQQAEETAEVLHRKLISKESFCSDWRKENPNFNVKQWCVDNNISYKSEWNDLSDFWITQEIKGYISENDYLTDNFRRSRYIYHPKHIDTWCDDNSVEYDRSLDNWDNYEKVMDYLDLPENIELLSKFWKDGTGNFAFVKEEIVLQKTYIEIGKELKDLPESSKLLAVSKEYEESAYKLLLEILEKKQTDKQSKSQARGILQEANWDEIPF